MGQKVNMDENFPILEVSTSSRLEESILSRSASATFSFSELYPMPYDDFMIETFDITCNSCSDLDASHVQNGCSCLESPSRCVLAFQEPSESRRSIMSSTSNLEIQQRENDQNRTLWYQWYAGMKVETMNRRQRGRPYKFHWEVAKCIPASYRKSTERAYKTQKPSGWCHICNRSSTRVRLVPCFNGRYNRCRKSICLLCIHRYYLQQPNIPPCMSSKDKFFCSHCLGICPVNSQCRTYQKTNVRRHIQSLLDKQKD